MNTIIKKIDTEWFDLIESGKKKFELRLADFDIAEGDILRLEEWVGEGESRHATGRVIEKVVMYTQKEDLKQWIQSQPEIVEKGFHVISFE